jgi:hypothetical protein
MKINTKEKQKMKFKTAETIREIIVKIKYDNCYDSEKIPCEITPSMVVMKKLEFERALLMAYAKGLENGKKNPNEEV